MAGGYDFFKVGSSGRSFRDEDFEEEDVWSVVMDIKEPTSNDRKPKDTSHISSVSSTPTLKRFPTASRMIPRANNSSHEAKLIQKSSAPVNIPDWSKIYGKNPTKGSDGGYSYGYGGGYILSGGLDRIVGDDDEDEEDLIPPHEWISKKLWMSQISSFSVCEGVGRTLKGRDLSKVRNAVLTRTGFLE
ncbi:uncharacterized protein LOC122059359 [Macadamia integrifolia]|uniref:uncharacterized protein LOC122059359 n=1 Tax=Macadamia integrifolia TaxID=60698 RepID=UPI001C52E733|nr:uncharacterized protein LOC122059359 [Macadamia integrifolia]XP_042478029.1 uncharacterized protein LOC122059359 [Macadamia integrifolia]